MMLFSPIRNPLADDRAVPDPDIFSDADGNRLPDRESAVIHPVPVGIGHESAVRQHAALADEDLRRGADPHPREMRQ